MGKDNKEKLSCPNCERLEGIIKELKLKIKQLEKKVAQLEKILAKYENAHTPPSCLKKSNPHPLVNPKKIGSPKGHKGITRPKPFPDEIVDVKTKTCPYCQGKLGRPTKIETKTIEDIPKPQSAKTIEYWIAHYKCSHCKREVVASCPDIPSCGGRFGKNLLSKVVLLKYSERLPHRKIANLLKRDYGLNISPGAIFEITNRTAQTLSEEYIRIAKKLRRRKVVNVDETGIKVNGRQYWIWIFTTPKETLVTIRNTRGSDVVKEILGENFKGIIVADGLKVYVKFTNRIQRCWAHILREARYIAERVKEAIPLKEALYRLYHSITSHSPPEEKRIRMYRNAIQRLRYWLRKGWNVPSILKFIKKLTDALPYLFTFILNPKVEPTNNRAERGLREHVVIRKIIGTMRNEKGTRIYETITSSLATWKQNGLNPNEMLKFALSS